MVSKRLFIAIEPPAEVIREIKRIQICLKQQDLFCGNYVKPEDAHITLKFLGNINERLIPKISGKLSKIKSSTISIQLGALDFFRPSKTREPRILYCSIISSDLINLAYLVDHSLIGICQKQKHSTVNHLTIARIKKIIDYDAFKRVVKSFKVNQIMFKIDSFVLKESWLSLTGPYYKVVKRYYLE